MRFLIPLDLKKPCRTWGVFLHGKLGVLGVATISFCGHYAILQHHRPAQALQALQDHCQEEPAGRSDGRDPAVAAGRTRPLKLQQALLPCRILSKVIVSWFVKFMRLTFVFLFCEAPYGYPKSFLIFFTFHFGCLFHPYAAACY